MPGRPRRRAMTAGALAGLLLVAGCGGAGDPVTVTTETTTSTTQGGIPAYPAGLTDHPIDVDGVERSYLTYVPPDLVEPRAIVVVLHGGGGEGAEAAADGGKPTSVFRDVADREGLVVVYPQGSPTADAEERSGWEDCRADSTIRTGVDDVGFLARLVEQLEGEYGLGSDRVFLAGTSNGAMMAQAFALYRPDLVAAVASNAGNLAADPFPGPCTDGPDRAVPILLAHGTADTAMPFEGGCVADLGGNCRRGRVISAEATVNRWLEINGLAAVSPDSRTIEVDANGRIPSLPRVRTVEVDPNDSGPATEIVLDGPAPVHVWRFDGAGHAAPSIRVAVATTRLAGVQNRDVEFAEIAWAFFAARLPDNG